MQKIAIADNEPQLQTTIARALTKVERALYGTASSIGNQKNGGTSTGMYSHLPPGELDGSIQHHLGKSYQDTPNGGDHGVTQDAAEL